MKERSGKGIALLPLILIIVAIVVIGGIITGVVLINNYKNKEPITANSFENIMKEKDYEVYDVKESLFYGVDAVEKALVAVKGNQKYQIEFYKIDSEEYAMYMYNLNKTKFEAFKTGNSMETSVDIGNVSKYTLTTDSKFKVISRVADTAIYLDVDKEYKDEVKALLKELGY